jgi:hypothetical protein
MAQTALTPAMVATLKTFVAASVDAAIVDARTRGDTFALAPLLNLPAAGPVKAWATVLPQVIDEATPWVNFDNITQAGKRDSYLIAFFRYPRDFATAAVRKWVTDVWGNATSGSDAEKILLAGQENATVAQNAIGGTVRTTNSVSGLDRNYVGQVSQDECRAILAA